MLIRSQGKKILVDMNTVIIHIFDRDIACYAPSCISDDGFLYLGSYETEEKALKVLDMIQEAYVNGHIDYQMPEDSEVVV